MVQKIHAKAEVEFRVREDGPRTRPDSPDARHETSFGQRDPNPALSFRVNYIIWLDKLIWKHYHWPSSIERVVVVEHACMAWPLIRRSSCVLLRHSRAMASQTQSLQAIYFGPFDVTPQVRRRWVSREFAGFTLTQFPKIVMSRYAIPLNRLFSMS